MLWASRSGGAVESQTVRYTLDDGTTVELEIEKPRGVAEVSASRRIIVTPMCEGVEMMTPTTRALCRLRAAGAGPSRYGDVL